MLEDLGIARELIETREALAARLSPAARHAAFPRIYARPLPVTNQVERLQRRLADAMRHAAEQADEIKGLRAQIATLAKALGDMQLNAVSLAGRTTIAQVKEAFLLALAVEHHTVDGASLAESHLTAPGKSPRHARPRHIAIWLCRELTGQSYSVIARNFGDRDHTSVIHALRQVKSGVSFATPDLRRAANRVLVQFHREPSA